MAINSNSIKNGSANLREDAFTAHCPPYGSELSRGPDTAGGSLTRTAFCQPQGRSDHAPGGLGEVIWEMPFHRACNRNDTEYDARAA